MSDDNGNSAAAVPAAHNPAEQLWKAPHTVADTQHPIKLKTAEFDSGFNPYEIEYGVVHDWVEWLARNHELLNFHPPLEVAS